MTILTQDFVFAALEQEKAGNNFPIDFDDVWLALGYSRKDNAVRKLRNDLDSEYFIILSIEGDYNSQKIDKFYLSIEGFKHFALMSKTLEGKEVRKYFIEIEKAYRQQLERQFKASSNTRNSRKYRVSTNVVKNSRLAELQDDIEWLVDDNKRLLRNCIELQKEVKELRGTFDLDDKDFKYTVDDIMNTLNLMPGSPYDSRLKYVVNMIRKDGAVNVDYIMCHDKSNQIYYINFRFLILLMICCRTKLGSNNSTIPKHILLDKHYLFKSLERNTNTRFPKT